VTIRCAGGEVHLTKRRLLKIIAPSSNLDYKHEATSTRSGAASAEDQLPKHIEPPEAHSEHEQNWWDYCPICSSRLNNLKCKYICPNPKCNFFMSCSEFDL
jgi:hypothetical protein